jgi:hypothetical protein
LYDLESWNKSTQLSQAVGHGFERFYRHGGADDGVAPGLVPAGVVGTDHESHGARLDGREAEAVNEDLFQGLQPPSAEGTSLLVALLPRLCEKLDAVAQQGDRLKRVEDNQNDIKDKIDKSADAHQKLQEKYLEQSHKHELEIQAIQLKLQNYDTTVAKVEELDKKVFAYALLAAAAGALAGALFAGLPGWLERHPLQKASFIASSALVRGRG